MNVLSLFDGMSCGRIALEQAGIPVTNYFASEIDESAIGVSKFNYPDIIRLGGVTGVSLGFSCKHGETFITSTSEPDAILNGKIDLLIAGSPCQGFSNTGDGTAFNHKSSKLFFEFVRVLKEAKQINPSVLFLLENVKMKKEWRDIITSYLGVEPIMIDSALVSAQKRRRYYWTNIQNVEQPRDLGIMIQDILLDGVAVLRWQNSNAGAVIDFNKAATLRAGNKSDGIWKIQKVVLDENDENLIIKEATKKGFAMVYPGEIYDIGFPDSCTRRGRVMKCKTNCMTATKIDWRLYIAKGKHRLIHPIECERLQNVPDNYTETATENQRYKMLGNGWNINTIKHIFKNIPL